MGSANGIKPTRNRVIRDTTINETEIIMSQRTRMSSIATLVALIVVAAAPVFAETQPTEISIGNDTCCFDNPRYSGTCQVTTGPDESCSDVLSYLNNQASVGKTYCGNTKVRGGWAQIDCEGASTMCAPPAASTNEAPRRDGT